MRKQLPRLVLLGALLSPSALYALALGDLKLNSALNQPFDAEIELVNPTSEELAELKVGLANNEAFTRYGLERPAFLSNFEFSVTRNRDGRSAIKVTSNSSVTEPFVTLLVEVVSGRGRLLREFTVLLDPPVELPGQPANPTPVTTPVAGTQDGAVERTPPPPSEPVAETTPPPAPVAETEPVAPPEPVAPVAEQAPPPPPEPVAYVPPPTPTPTPVEEPVPSPPVAVEPSPAPIPSPAPVSAGSYTVQRNDTLSQIVRDVVRPGVKGRGDINRTMIALFRANPTAFNDNINRMKAGAVLRVPDMAEIEAITAGDASSEVARQAQAWGGPARMASAGPRGDQLKLLPPRDSSRAPVAVPKGVPDASGSSTGQGNASKDPRFALQNESLANVERSQKPVEPVAKPAPPKPTTLAQQVDPEPAPPPANREPVDTTPTAPQGDAVPLPTENQPGFVERLSDFWWVPIVLGLLVALIALVAFLRRRRDPDLGDALDPPPLTFEPRIASEMQQNNRRNRGDAFGLSKEPLPDDDEEDAPAPAASFGQRNDRVTVFREEPVARAMPEPAPAPAPKPKVVPPPAARSVEDTISSETAVRFDQQDALAEADFHMAYGLYDQAADLVKIAIDREPGRRELKLKLLEIYFVWGNRDLFLETANELHRSRERSAPGEWENILIMGRQIAPEEPMFKGDGARVDLVDVNLEGGENRVDVDLFAAPETSRSEALDLEFASGERAGPDSDIDYLLDETRTRDYDPLSRTQETPTIESPVLESTGQTSRMRALNGRKGQPTPAMARNGAYEDTTALRGGGLRDDERTQLAPSLSSLDRTMLAPRDADNAIYIDQVDLTQGGDTVEQRRPGRSGRAEEDYEQAGSGDTFSDEVFNGGTNRFERIDLDVGDSLATEDRTAATARQARSGLELSELEPVTMSEVGTKLDLARAYMDMGDPDGARSILEEVVEEGNVSQKQEAQRLLESVR